MFPVDVVAINGELQYGELERTAQSLDKGTAYRVILGTDTAIIEVDGSRILSRRRRWRTRQQPDRTRTRRLNSTNTPHTLTLFFLAG